MDAKEQMRLSGSVESASSALLRYSPLGSMLEPSETAARCAPSIPAISILQNSAKKLGYDFAAHAASSISTGESALVAPTAVAMAILWSERVLKLPPRNLPDVPFTRNSSLDDFASTSKPCRTSSRESSRQFSWMSRIAACTCPTSCPYRRLSIS